MTCGVGIAARVTHTRARHGPLPTSPDTFPGRAINPERRRRSPTAPDDRRRRYVLGECTARTGQVYPLRGLSGDRRGAVCRRPTVQQSPAEAAETRRTGSAAGDSSDGYVANTRCGFSAARSRPVLCRRRPETTHGRRLNIQHF